MSMRRNNIRLAEWQLYRTIKNSLTAILNPKKNARNENLKWHIDDVCSEFGEGSVVINGTFGSLDGKYNMLSQKHNNIKDAIRNCLGNDGAIVHPADLYADNNGHIHLTVAHNNGVDVFTITKAMV